MALTARKRRQGNIADHRWLLGVVSILRQPVVVLDDLYRIVAASDAFCELVGAMPDQAVGHALADVGNGFLNVPGLQEFLDLLESGSTGASGYRLKVGLGSPDQRTLILNARFIPAEAPGRSVILTIEDAAPTVPQHRPASGIALSQQKHGQMLATLATTNHDLRQPLQTLSLLQGVLAVREKDPELRELIGRFEQAIEALTGMLNAMVSVEQLTAGPVSPEILSFPIGSVIDRLKTELSYHAEARGIECRIVPCSVAVRSDPRLLGQVLRALLLSAMKLIRRGKVLFGCRRLPGKIVIQIWIEGTGVPAEQQEATLNEFRALNGSSSGTSLAAALVKPLSDLLHLAVKARSRAGDGLVFTAEVPIDSQLAEAAIRRGESSKGAILVASDDPSVRDALVLLLREIGHEATPTSVDDGFATLVGNKSGSIRPEIVVIDVLEPNEPAASQTISALRWTLGWKIPAIVLVDEVSNGIRAHAVGEPCLYLPKPVRPGELASQISRLLGIVRGRAGTAASTRRERDTLLQTVFVIDDDSLLRDAVRDVLGVQGRDVELYPTGESFLEIYNRDRRGCLIVDNKLPGMTGVDVLEHLKSEGVILPSIMITGHGDIPTAVRALKAGAIDYIEKPISYEGLLSAIERALEIDRGSADALIKRRELAARIAELTPRERQVMDLVVSGRSSKRIAQALNISQRTVENHRAAIMKRAGAKSLPDLIRIVMQLTLSDDHQN